VANPPTHSDEPVATAEREPLAPRRELSPVDIRRKRPPALSFLLRAETLRRCARVLTLLALDLRLPDLGAHVSDAQLRHALGDQ